jgi:hypothetical protein
MNSVGAVCVLTDVEFQLADIFDDIGPDNLIWVSPVISLPKFPYLCNRRIHIRLATLPPVHQATSQISVRTVRMGGSLIANADRLSACCD